MPRVKGKGKVRGKPKQKSTIHKKATAPATTPETQTDEQQPIQNDSQQTQKPVKGCVCANCKSCDVSATGIGYCTQQEVRKLLAGWDRIILYPDQFGCLHHS